MRTLLIPIVMLIASLTSCIKNNKEEVEPPQLNTKFKWIDSSNKFYYDYYTADTIIKDQRSLTTWRRFQEESPAFENPMGQYIRILDRDIVIKEDGLYGRAANSCGFFSSYFEFLYAPNVATPGQIIPVYGCGKVANDTITIVAVDTLITVPMGTFKTYVMEHEWGERSYWSADSGLIMYDRHDYRGQYLGSLKLNRVEKWR